MPDSKDAQLHDVAILTRAVENVFRKLIRFLVGKISLVKLQEMTRVIYIQEAETFIKKEDNQEKISMTKLGVLTGLDTRTLSSVINSPAFSSSLSREHHFLKELTPTTAVVGVWTSEEPFFNSKMKRPRKLPVSGSHPSFESLVSATIRGRGITAASLLQRLTSSGATRIDEKSGKVTLIQESYLPKNINDYLGFIELGLTAVSSLIDTINYNLEALYQGEKRLYQRGAWTFNLPVANREEVRLRLDELLKKTEKDARDILKNYENNKVPGPHITSGVGMFYFEENPET